MEQYIKKSALVAEIDKKLHQLTDAAFDSMIGRNLIEIKDFINTLEVKEVDLEKELDSMITPELKFHKAFPSLFDVAKHFFELGLKTQIMTPKLQQRISVLKMGFWTGLQTFEETEMTLSDAYNQGVDDILEELGLKAQKGEEV